MLTNASLTIYNRVPDVGQKRFIYRRHFIHAVHFYTDQKIEIVNGSLNSADVYKIRIPQDYLIDYVPYEELIAEADNQKLWTVEKEDLFIVGEGPDEIQGITDLKSRYRPCGIVKSWSDNRRGIQPHIRIGGAA